ncbi:nucleoside diphosphate-linked moiety X motif 6-like [Anneissia japonica]|uniref:nucleoside diphosphate-linked moiety X motif 6-like n=1 Tax=Anneissia japonica TaxID=1529436 RepID=UPI00142569A1|nr:nucleoside diphosphate-linked moiety X motif 6-like [Anneissia japonica]
METFNGKKDQYNGIIINIKEHKCDSEKIFNDRLKRSLEEWNTSGIRGVWLKIAIECAAFIAVAAKHGFVFHHAQTDYVMMIKWLPTDEPNQLPGYTTHYVGVAGFVVNENNQVLVVKERFYKKANWKLPGGMADPGEDLGVTAKREVFEETGIEAEFISLLAFRQQHGFRFGQSDLYFVCEMKALNSEIASCQHEISDCMWMNVDEYVALPDISPANRQFAQEYLKQKQRGRSFKIKPRRVLSYDHKKYHLLYSIQDCNIEENWQEYPPNDNS